MPSAGDRPISRVGRKVSCHPSVYTSQPAVAIDVIVITQKAESNIECVLLLFLGIYSRGGAIHVEDVVVPLGK